MATHDPVDAQDRGLGELVKDLASQTSTLVRQEIRLAQAEVTQRGKLAGKGAGMLAGAGVAGHFVLLFLSLALWWALGDVMGLGWSGVVVAIIWGVVAAILARGVKL